MTGDAVSVVLVADTHGWLDPRVAEIVARCDIAVHAGDVGAAEVLDLLEPRTGDVYAVLGNNDRFSKWDRKEHRVLEALDDKAELALPGGVLVVEHGDDANPAAKRHELLRRRHPEAHAVVYGHSHRRVCDLDQRPWVLNPGAAGRTRTYGGPSCLVLVATESAWSVHEHVFELRPK